MEVKLPSFTRGKKQLSHLEVDTSRQLVQVRIHFERVIGLIHNTLSCVLLNCFLWHLFQCIYGYNKDNKYFLLKAWICLCVQLL